MLADTCGDFTKVWIYLWKSLITESDLALNQLSFGVFFPCKCLNIFHMNNVRCVTVCFKMSNAEKLLIIEYFVNVVSGS